MLASGITSGNPRVIVQKTDPFENTKRISEQEHNQFFNMCGYAAPKLEKVRVGFIGLGSRGPVNLDSMAYLEGVEITALCDKRMDMVAWIF